MSYTTQSYMDMPMYFKKKWLRLYIFLCSSTLRMKVDTVILNYTFGPEGQILSAWLEKFCKTVTVYFLLKAMKMVV